MESRFINAGPKNIKVLVRAANQSVQSFDLQLNVLNLADVSHGLVQGAYAYQSRFNEWQPRSVYEGDVNSDIDYKPDPIDGVESIVSTLENYDETALVIKTQGSGVLSFDWMVEDSDVLDLSVYMNGELYKKLDIDGLFVREEILVDSEGVSTFEFRLSPGDEWPSTLAMQSDAKTLQAHLKTLRFEADSSPVEAKSLSSKGSDSGGGSGLWLVLLGLVLCVSKLREQTNG